MTVAPARARPLIAVLSRVPLLVEALSAAFEGIAEVHGVSADDIEAHGLVRAFRPDAVIAEGDAVEMVHSDVPCVRVELEAHRISVRDGDVWRVLDVEVSPETIRNVTVARLYGGDVA